MYPILDIKSNFLVENHVIDKVEKYINKKYPNNTFKQNKVILADTLNRIMNRNLNGFDQDVKEEVIEETINSLMENNLSEITVFDVFEACKVISRKKPEIKDKILEGINKELNTEFSIAELEEYMKEDLVGDNLEHKEALSLEGNNESVLISNRVVGEGICGKFKDVYRKLLDIKLIKVNKYVMALICSLCIALAINSYLKERSLKAEALMKQEYRTGLINMYDEYKEYAPKEIVKYDILACHPHLPEEFDYTELDIYELKEYLQSRNSILAEEPYFTSIMSSARSFNLNPLVLFSITGQEQGFVPKDNENALKIANNPFNVFVSWRDYNTDIKDSSEIAARTVINLAKGKPDNIESFEWINRLYADDEEWHEGVSYFFSKLMEVCVID